MKKEDRKKELLRTAYELFMSRGYDAVSVDDIIAKAGIAKGTYYYYFKSKEETLEEVIDMMIAKEEQRALTILEMDIPVPNKIVGIMTSFRPDENEREIAEMLNRKENIVMHEKVNAKIIQAALPLLTKAGEEGISQGIMNCDYLEERIRLILILSMQLFDEGMANEGSLIVYIDIVEKILGAKKGTMDFLKEIILG